MREASGRCWLVRMKLACLALVLAVVGLVACGGGDDSSKLPPGVSDKSAAGSSADEDGGAPVTPKGFKKFSDEDTEATPEK